MAKKGRDGMDEKVWQAYEEQHRQLQRQFRRHRWRVWLIWLGYILVTNGAVVLFMYPWDMAYAVCALVLNSFVSLFLACFATARWLKEEQKQKQQLIEKAPIGKMRL